MRMSCNGCRVLRKGCGDDCSIRPCLDWIQSPDSQANATVFLAKFYGRAGLMNLVNAGPQHLRPAIFRSLLYEACGRIVNPIYGAVGLLWAGNWHLCQNSVEAVLRGAPTTQIPADANEAKNGPPLKAYDIRHVSVEDADSGSTDLHRIRTRYRFKRPGTKRRRSRLCAGPGDESGCEEVKNWSPSHESSLSHQSVTAEPNVERESLDLDENAEPDNGSELALCTDREDDRRAREEEIKLDLTLGFKPFKRGVMPKEVAVSGARDGPARDEAGLCKMELART
ncbi:hypothetical protein OROGR_008002 [Orobanche gracilis]